MPPPDVSAKSPPQPSAIPSGAAPQTESQTWPAVDRRSGRDRRQRPTTPWGNFFGLKRRKRGRRKGEERNSFVDLYRKRDAALLISILVLNLLDALLTLIHIQRGGQEANPVMERLLSDGDYGSFLFQKCAIVGSLLLILVVHKNHVIARRAIWALFAGYLALFAYHIALQSFGVYSGR
jgi:hypothetical protein